MNRVVAVVEGQTEQMFVQNVLAPHLALKNVDISARLPGRHSRRGGVRAWESIRGDILRTLKEDAGRFCTTMFDFYGMPLDWPGRDRAVELPWDQRGGYVEEALAQDVAAHLGADFRVERFIPYVQIHEFEALLFSDVEVLGDVLKGIAETRAGNLPEKLAGIVSEAGAPEAINDNSATAPSKRIQALSTGYRKPTHGVITAKRIPIETIRGQCPGFARWLARLEGLGE